MDTIFDYLSVLLSDKTLLSTLPAFHYIVVCLLAFSSMDLIYILSTIILVKMLFV